MHLHLEKCTSDVKIKNFLGYYLIKRKIEVNLYDCYAVIDMMTQNTERWIQGLNNMLIFFSKFILKFVHYRKNAAFHYTSECITTFSNFKEILSQLLILIRPKKGGSLFVYLFIFEKIHWSRSGIGR